MSASTVKTPVCLLCTLTPSATPPVYSRSVRIRFTGPAEAHAQTLRDAGAADLRIDGDTASIGPGAGTLRTPDLVRRLVEAGAGIEAVEPEDASLEQVYLRLLKGGRP